MQPEEQERQINDALAHAAHHVQLRIERYDFPDAVALASGRTTGQMRGTVVTIFRSGTRQLEIGQSLTIKLPHCVASSDSEYFLMGGFAIIQDPLLDAGFIEAVLDAALNVASGLIIALPAPTTEPVLRASEFDL